MPGLSSLPKPVLLALASRLLILAALLLAGWAFRDLDSSSRLALGFPCAGAGRTAAAGSAAAAPPQTHALLPLPVWDTVYFSRVAKCGYETDKINAFFPLVPALMRGAGAALAALPTLVGGPPLAPEAAHTLAGLGASAAAFCVAALCLHRLALRALGGDAHARRLADLSVLFFCANPASVFYSAAYSESLFAAATWAGLLLLPTHHWAGVAAFVAAAAARSNGILAVWFPLHKLLREWRRRGRLPAREAARAALSAAAILAPYAAMQARAYREHCTGGTGRPAWCDAALPSVYGFIQKEYWDVGLLRFYRDPARLPMVLMSAPVAWLSVGACWAYFAADWKRALTLGLYSGARRLPAWLARPAGAAQRATAVWRSWRAGARGGGGNGSAGGSRAKAGGRGAAGGARRGQGPPSALQRSGDAAPLMYHWALMTAVALLAMHVNVATRFLSACPPLHWHAAEVLARRGAASRLLWLWCLAYLALGCLLFPNFYPWT